MQNLSFPVSRILPVLLVISIAFSITLGIFYLKHRQLQRQLNTNTSILEEKEAEIRTVRMQNGHLKQEKQAAILDASMARQSMQYYQEEARDLKENHGVKIRDLHAYYRATLETTGSGTAQLQDTTMATVDEHGDTTQTPAYSLTIDDGYLYLTGLFSPGGSPTLGGTEGGYQYTVTDSISIAYAWTRKGIWPFRSNDKLMVSFHGQNPNTRLQSVTSLVIQDTEKKRFAIGPYAGYGITGDGRLTPQVGIGVMWSMVKF